MQRLICGSLPDNAYESCMVSHKDVLFYSDTTLHIYFVGFHTGVTSWFPKIQGQPRVIAKSCSGAHRRSGPRVMPLEVNPDSQRINRGQMSRHT